MKKVKKSQKSNIKIDTCVLCICDITKKEKTVILKCKHIFHKDCILNLRNNICPLCRTILTKDDIGKKLFKTIRKRKEEDIISEINEESRFLQDLFPEYSDDSPELDSSEFNFGNYYNHESVWCRYDDSSDDSLLDNEVPFDIRSFYENNFNNNDRLDNIMNELYDKYGNEVYIPHELTIITRFIQSIFQMF